MLALCNRSAIAVLMMWSLASSYGCGRWYSKYGIKDEKELHSFGAVPKLIKALEQGNCYDGMNAADVLVSVGEQARSAFFALEHFVKRPDCKLRQRAPAAVALGQLGKPAYNILLRALRSKDSELRYLAVVALGHMTFLEPKVIALLSRKIVSKDPLDLRSDAKKEAFVSLGKHGQAAYSSIPLLVKMLKDEQWQAPAMDAIVAIGVPSRMALDALKELADKTTEEDLKAQIMRSYKELLSKANTSKTRH